MKIRKFFASIICVVIMMLPMMVYAEVNLYADKEGPLTFSLEEDTINVAKKGDTFDLIIDVDDVVGPGGFCRYRVFQPLIQFSVDDIVEFKSFSLVDGAITSGKTTFAPKGIDKITNKKFCAPFFSDFKADESNETDKAILKMTFEVKADSADPVIITLSGSNTQIVSYYDDEDEYDDVNLGGTLRDYGDSRYSFNTMTATVNFGEPAPAVPTITPVLTVGSAGEGALLQTEGAVPEVGVGSHFKVKAAIKPDQATALGSASVELNYDQEYVKCVGAEPNAAVKNCEATFETGKASFISADGESVDIPETGLELATFEFETLKVTDPAATGISISATAEGAIVDNATEVKTQNGDPVNVKIVREIIHGESYAGNVYNIAKYTTDSMPAEGNAYFFGDTPMTYVPEYATKDNEYVFVALTTDSSDRSVTEKQGEYKTIRQEDNNFGDANMDGKTNIVDAQAVVNMAGGKFAADDTSLDWLHADVNASSNLTFDDARSIQYFVHYGKWGSWTAS